jgi:hypothetical protein
LGLQPAATINSANAIRTIVGSSCAFRIVINSCRAPLTGNNRVRSGIGLNAAVISSMVLDESAIRAAEQIRLKPAQRIGQAVDSTVSIRIIFHIE